ncbi:hypothetical protein PpBr36_00421 [Pyricularia pennisetigena]|uniref:hypothetical protein n=1 Tax=Pyricularia pennisetigena TaxID=1578925 RepID=UPI00114F5672|nr:hypothetical protein PpBr36_00421 [Pyricularia pennisetigena]TLS28444.1 hypothetical protein PpBr36_00421 [Pyricularia pennisetigena]
MARHEPPSPQNAWKSNTGARLGTEIDNSTPRRPTKPGPSLTWVAPGKGHHSNSDHAATSTVNDSIPQSSPPSARQQQHKHAPSASTMAAETEVQEYDDFGLPIRKFVPPPQPPPQPETDSPGAGEQAVDNDSATASKRKWSLSMRRGQSTASQTGSRSSSIVSQNPSKNDVESGSEQSFKDAPSNPVTRAPTRERPGDVGVEDEPLTPVPPNIVTDTTASKEKAVEPPEKTPTPRDTAPLSSEKAGQATEKKTRMPAAKKSDQREQVKLTDAKDKPPPATAPAAGHSRELSVASVTSVTSNATESAQVSEFSHQALTAKKEEEEEDNDGGWQTMPSFAAYDMYDDDDRLVAKEFKEEDDDQKYGYGGLGGAGKGYTRVLVDDDADSVTSMDDNTQYLFSKAQGTSLTEEEEARDAVSQMQATKDLLTEGQRIAYVGITRLEIFGMVKEFEQMEQTKKSKKEIRFASEATKMWAQKMMIRLYAHMEVSAEEQVMIEQLTDHGVRTEDLTPALMANARVKNPMAEDAQEGEAEKGDASSSGSTPLPKSPATTTNLTATSDGYKKHDNSDSEDDEECAAPPPPYQAHAMDEMDNVQTPNQMTKSAQIDIDLRWTVLCDLFLVLIADSVYDSRSRCLLERVGKSLEITWLEICRFEKKVTDALEMQQQAEKENWNEEEHMDSRRKMALKRRYVMMGLATVGGGLVIGLSAGLLAPLIGSGLVAGFAAIGVGASSTTFLAGASGTAIIASSAAASGSIIGVRAANRRTGSVRTFEYRPLHNNKRVNLIITVSGWMTGKVDDVRLPFSTVDPTMGDIYSILWEPEMLRSMGDTINILATEALTQGLQQVLASTFLTSLMAALTLPVVLTKLSYLIDNPWAVSQDRAWAAGLILADSLIDRNLGTRPVTLVGYSLGARVIFSCLLELARKGALGLVQNVYLFGAPVVVKQDEWLRIRTVVSGRFVTGFSKSDWILGYLFRLTSGGIRRVAGLAPVEGIPGVENMDVSEFVQGHMDYRAKMPRLLRECGWIVESDEFTEIEDPDPENHAARQRELINEIEEARKEMEKENKANKGGWLSFGRKRKAPKRKDWEIYEDQGDKNANGGAAAPSGKTEDKEGNNHGVLFDVDAIRAELAKEASRGGEAAEEILQVRELPSTLPPMKLSTANLIPSPGFAPTSAMSTASSFPKSPRDNLRSAHSAGATPTYRTSYEYRLSEERSPSSLKAPGQQYPATGNGYRGASPSHKTFDYGGFGGGDDMDGGIQMTFDTSFDDTPHRHEAAPPPLYPTSSAGVTTEAWTLKKDAPSAGYSTASPSITTSTAAPAGAGRPIIATSQSTPAVPPSNPWANYDDDDDPEFGKEKEISMTFA